MPGRGMGERLVVDPNNGSILFLGARSGNGLWKSTDYGSTWAKVNAFPNAGKYTSNFSCNLCFGQRLVLTYFQGTYIPDPSDVGGLNGDKIGIAWITFDSTSAVRGTATPRIYVGVAEKNGQNVFVSTNGGTACMNPP